MAILFCCVTYISENKDKKPNCFIVQMKAVFQILLPVLVKFPDSEHRHGWTPGYRPYGLKQLFWLSLCVESYSIYTFGLLLEGHIIPLKTQYG